MKRCDRGTFFQKLSCAERQAILRSAPSLESDLGLMVDNRQIACNTTSNGSPTYPHSVTARGATSGEAPNLTEPLSHKLDAAIDNHSCEKTSQYAGSTSNIVEKKWDRNTSTVTSRQTVERDTQLRYEVERLRVQAASLAAENDELKSQLSSLQRTQAETEGALMLQGVEFQKLHEKTVMDAAASTAQLEDKCERAHRMLEELAVASEALAQDNVLLSSEVVSSREAAREASSEVVSLQGRLDCLQELYTSALNEHKLIPGVDADIYTKLRRRQENTTHHLGQLTTQRVVAHSRPPTDFAVQLASQNGAGKSLTSANVAKLEASKPQDTDEADDKNDIQRHRLEQCNCRLSALEEENSWLKSVVATTRQTAAKLVHNEKQRVVGSLRQLQSMAEKQSELEQQTMGQKAYVLALEQRLLLQHRKMKEFSQVLHQGENEAVTCFHNNPEKFLTTHSAKKIPSSTLQAT